MSNDERADEHTNVDELKQLVADFRDERGWAAHHTPKNLSMSIAIEAAELMELFQWIDIPAGDDRQKVADELADVLIYCLNFADTLGIDISTAVRRKLERVKAKYPAAIFKPGRDDAASYNRIKQAHRADRE